MSENYQWHSKGFSQLSTEELFDCLKLRVDVFVVEQECFYPELDELDRAPETRHLFAYSDNNEVLAYCRLLAPDSVYENESAIGRVVVAPQARNQKLGLSLMQRALAEIDRRWPEQSCHISAQEYLLTFYQSLGFKQITPMYLEDGIPHVGMRRGSTQ